jgi:hypothetical protein
MLDPWVRVPLAISDVKTGKYKAEFYVIFNLTNRLLQNKVFINSR